MENQRLSEQIGVLSLRLSERDRLIGRFEEVVRSLVAFCPQEAVTLRASAERLLRDVEVLYGDGDYGSD